MCWLPVAMEATEKSGKGLRSPQKRKAKKNKIYALIRQLQYFQENSLKAEVFNEKEERSSGKSSLTAPLIKPHLKIKLDKGMEKTLNKVPLPLKKQRSSHRTSVSLNLPDGPQRKQKLSSPLRGYRGCN